MLKVKFMKYFVNGNLKGLTHDTEITVSGLEEACSWVDWAHKHSDKPVEAFGGSDYTVHCSRVVSED